MKRFIGTIVALLLLPVYCLAEELYLFENIPFGFGRDFYALALEESHGILFADPVVYTNEDWSYITLISGMVEEPPLWEDVFHLEYREIWPNPKNDDATMYEIVSLVPEPLKVNDESEYDEKQDAFAQQTQATMDKLLSLYGTPDYMALTLQSNPNEWEEGISPYSYQCLIINKAELETMSLPLSIKDASGQYHFPHTSGNINIEYQFSNVCFTIASSFQKLHSREGYEGFLSATISYFSFVREKPQPMNEFLPQKEMK